MLFSIFTQCADCFLRFALHLSHVVQIVSVNSHLDGSDQCMGCHNYGNNLMCAMALTTLIITNQETVARNMLEPPSACVPFFHRLNLNIHTLLLSL